MEDGDSFYFSRVGKQAGIQYDIKSKKRRLLKNQKKSLKEIITQDFDFESDNDENYEFFKEIKKS